MSLACSFQVLCIDPHVCGPLLRKFGLEKSGLKTALSHVEAGTQECLSENRSNDFLKSHDLLHSLVYISSNKQTKIKSKYVSRILFPLLQKRQFSSDSFFKNKVHT